MKVLYVKKAWNRAVFFKTPSVTSYQFSTGGLRGLVVRHEEGVDLNTLRLIFQH